MITQQMKHTIIFLLIIFSTLKVEAKKIVSPIEIISGMADIIVIGEIDIVKDNSYTFKISETIKGQVYKTISVRKFKEWTCDTRFGKVKKGQRLCLFLKKGSTNWTIINGSTGELLILNNYITLGGDEEYIHVDYKFTPYRLSVQEFKNGIREFSKCYRFIGEYDFMDKKAHFEQICDDKQISKFKSINKFSAWLYKRMTKYPVIKA
ncbi:hypothetical protein [Flavobacterium taihuense]|uniref:DUF4468 domain-containing protein n=1 Tax=Flavobacterium taihuense TaxID=2857508 RepID=A0ABS6Y2Q8_9FLAO|nr:hypothetical protein [Flavobacterium taihuense]MBW4362821.1 hypothetical protein [Flavobacterium taihuense]